MKKAKSSRRSKTIRIKGFTYVRGGKRIKVKGYKRSR